MLHCTTMFEKFTANYLINTAFIQPSETENALVSEDVYNIISDIYSNTSNKPRIKIPSQKTHVSVTPDKTLPVNTIQYPTKDMYFNAKQREYLLATPKSPIHNLFTL